MNQLLRQSALAFFAFLLLFPAALNADGMPFPRYREPLVFSAVQERQQYASVEVLNNYYQKMSLYLSLSSLDFDEHNITVVIPLKSVPQDAVGSKVNASDFLSKHEFGKVENLLLEQSFFEAAKKIAPATRNYVAGYSLLSLFSPFGLVFWYLGVFAPPSMAAAGAYEAGVRSGKYIITPEGKVITREKFFEFEGATFEVFNVRGEGTLAEFVKNYYGMELPENVQAAVEKYKLHYIGVLQARVGPDLEGLGILKKYAPDALKEAITYVRNHPSFNVTTPYDCDYYYRQLEVYGEDYYGRNLDYYYQRCDKRQIIKQRFADLINKAVAEAEGKGGAGLEKIEKIKKLAFVKPTAPCSDSDGGSNILAIGECNARGFGSFVDSCSSQSTVVEYQCSYNNECLPSVLNCPSGYNCTDGACFSFTPLPNQNCSDSDAGKNYYVVGVVNWNTSSGYNYNPDYCSANALFEAYCMNNQPAYSVFQCPYGCANGACISTPPTCVDSDGGLAFFVKGSVSRPGTSGTYIDFCYDSVQLGERSCPFVGESPNITSYACPYGCSDGACLSSPRQECTDSDGGDNYFLKGTASNPAKGASAYTDYCLNAYALYEAYCPSSSSWPSFKNVNCENGCANGACLQGRAAGLALKVENAMIDFLLSAYAPSSKGFELSMLLPAREQSVFYPLGTGAAWSTPIEDTRILFKLSKDLEINFDSVQKTAVDGEKRYYYWTFKNWNPDYDLNGRIYPGVSFTTMVDDFLKKTAQDANRNSGAIAFILFLLVLAAAGFVVYKKRGALWQAVALVLFSPVITFWLVCLIPSILKPKFKEEEARKDFVTGLMYFGLLIAAFIVFAVAAAILGG